MSVFLVSWLAQEVSSFLCCHLQHVSLLCLTCAASAAPATVCLTVVVLVAVVLGVLYGSSQPLPFYDSELLSLKPANPPGQWVPGVNVQE